MRLYKCGNATWILLRITFVEAWKLLKQGYQLVREESSLNLTCQTRMPKYISPSSIIMLIMIGI